MRSLDDTVGPGAAPAPAHPPPGVPRPRPRPRRCQGVAEGAWPGELMKFWRSLSQPGHKLSTGRVGSKGNLQKLQLSSLNMTKNNFQLLAFFDICITNYEIQFPLLKASLSSCNLLVTFNLQEFFDPIFFRARISSATFPTASAPRSALLHLAVHSVLDK